jgi:hypothetical protein
MSCPSRAFLAAEFAILFVILPVMLSIHPTRLNVVLGLYLVAAYAATILHLTPEFSWRDAWGGIALTQRDCLAIALRFLLSSLTIVLVINLFMPAHLFSFPLQRPGLWLLVMVLYPFLSALPQELVFRTFFFQRYSALFRRPLMIAIASGVAFGFMHIVFHNAVSPLLSAIGGLFFSTSFMTHKSLKKVTLEHAVYGNMVFSAGLGLYFIVTSP